MILSTHGVLASQIASFDADAVAFFNRVTTAGGSLTLTEKQAVNTLVVDMKAYGIWSAMKAVYPMVGASAAACSQNLKSSNFTGTFTSGWTFASTGVKGNGTSAYMDLNINPSSELALTSAHLSLYSRTNQNRAEYDYASGHFGLLLYTNTFYIQLTTAGAYNVNTSLTNTTGFYLISRTNDTNVNGYRNSSKLINNASQNSSLPSMLLFGANSTSGNFSSKEYAIVSIGDGLTDTQAADFYTAVQAFQTTLSRQV